jgi:hypothetical protein
MNNQVWPKGKKQSRYNSQPDTAPDSTPSNNERCSSNTAEHSLGQAKNQN